MTDHHAVPVRTVEPSLRVTPLELFFDLVFVFTITQLTESLAHQLTLAGLLRVVVMLAVIWWMYDAFIWSANALPPSTHPRRGLLLLAMAGFLVISLSVAHAFEGSGVAFGWAYLLVVAVHTAMFRVVGVARGSVRRMGLLNCLNAGLVVTGGYLQGSTQLELWALAFGLQLVTPRLVGLHRFRLRADHFVERRGLVVIVAFGESVVAVGAGATGTELTPVVAVGALLALGVCVGLWWAYFGHDDEHAADFLAGLTDARRNRLAVSVYNLGHYALLLGILLLATGARPAVAHPTFPLTLPQATAVAGGIALFLLANTTTRHTLGLHPHTPRLLTAALLPATIPLATHHTALTQTATIAALLTLTFTWEERVLRVCPATGVSRVV
ncbi:low temperature requirement protein A [Kitasatospora sp. NPDC002227]|uniref:low temperature requirement protein A n=1 Tax=Kitasatospora sp. NPDC002227 TaxID=3154773 RepID=UPI00332DB07D